MRVRIHTRVHLIHLFFRYNATFKLITTLGIPTYHLNLLKNSGVVPPEQGVPIDGNNAERVATADAVGNKILQQHIMLLALDQEDDKDDKAGTAAPAQPSM